MSRGRLAATLLSLAALAAAAPPRAGAVEAGPAPRLILMIGDGMDDQILTIARNYMYGAAGSLFLESLPVRAAARVMTRTESKPDRPEYVADSANSATTLATGVLTSRGRLGTTAGTDQDIPNITELAAAAGLSTGLVTTSALTDATPAAFVVHVRHRLCQGPEDMLLTIAGTGESCQDDRKVAGGLGSIAEQLLSGSVDVLMGGGERYFRQSMPGDGRSVLALAAANGYAVIRSLERAAGVPPQQKLLALFADLNLPVEWRGEGGRKAGRLEFDAAGNPLAPAPFACVPNPNFGSTPTLEAMTEAALHRLGAAAQSSGFFLMVEGASIDKQAHLRNPCAQIGETLAFDRAVVRAQAFADAHPNTLLIVTSDHGQAAQIVPYPSIFADYARASHLGPQYTLGHLALIRTQEGGTMAVNYATNSSPASIGEEHTGTAVPVFASGPDSERISPLTSQAELFRVMAHHLGLQ